ncbi:MAG: MBL fold metallo-hydrolase [Coriobacteriia bacterium]
MPLAHIDDIPTGDCLEVAFLGSGSSGNATFVGCGSDAILIDCGFSTKETLRRLASNGCDAKSIRAILVTHEHSDHISGIRVTADKLGVPVYATRGTAGAAPAGSLGSHVERLTPGQAVRLGTLEVLPFDVSHDAAQPVGFRITGTCGTSLGLVTDTGHMTEAAFEALHDCELLGIECNHDVEMLRTGPYPWFLKQRIESPRGHLSNEDAISAIEQLASSRLRALFGVHVSAKNNTHRLVDEMLADAVSRIGLDVPTIAVAQHTWTPPVRGR